MASVWSHWHSSVVSISFSGETIYTDRLMASWNWNSWRRDNTTMLPNCKFRGHFDLRVICNRISIKFMTVQNICLHGVTRKMNKLCTLVINKSLTPITHELTVAHVSAQFHTMMRISFVFYFDNIVATSDKNFAILQLHCSISVNN